MACFFVISFSVASLYMLTRSRETDYEIACPLQAGGGTESARADFNHRELS